MRIYTFESHVARTYHVAILKLASCDIDYEADPTFCIGVKLLLVSYRDTPLSGKHARPTVYGGGVVQ